MKKKLVRGIVAVAMFSAVLCSAVVIADNVATSQEVVMTGRGTPRHPGKIDSKGAVAINHVGRGTPRHPG